MLRIHGLTMTFGPRTLWRDLDLTLAAGTTTALGGPSGSGKSTLLNCIGLLAQPTSGRIEFDGRELTSLAAGAARRFRRDQLGYLFQNYALIEDTTVRENLAVALRARRRRRAGAQAAMAAALERVGLAGRLEEKVARLSGGEQQRVALARLLLKQPQLILADEPTGALDWDNTQGVMALLRELADEGACVLIATHNDWVRAACDVQIDLAEPDQRPILPASTPGPAQPATEPAAGPVGPSVLESA